MDFSTAFLSPEQMSLAAIVWGVVYILGLTGLPSRFAPLSSLVLGVAVTFLLPSATVATTILAGLTVGLIASGAHSAVKTTTAPASEPA